MIYRESQKYLADLSKALGLLLVVPIGRWCLLLIFDDCFDLYDLAYSLISCFLGMLLLFAGYRFMLKRLGPRLSLSSE